MLTAPELYDLDNDGFTRDVKFYLERLAKVRGPILELGAGTGRVALPLAKAGHAVHALDRDEAMLGRLVEKAEAALSDEELARLTVVHGDAVSFKLKEKFAAVVAPFNFLYALPGDAALEGCLAAVRRALAPRGLFLLSVFNPDPLKLCGAAARRHIHTTRDAAGREVTLWETRRYDRIRQELAVTFHHEIRDGKRRETRRRDIVQHLVFPRALLARLRHAGFKTRATWGDFDGRPLEGDCAHVIVAAGKAAAQ